MLKLVLPIAMSKMLLVLLATCDHKTNVAALGFWNPPSTGFEQPPPSQGSPIGGGGYYQQLQNFGANAFNTGKKVLQENVLSFKSGLTRLEVSAQIRTDARPLYDCINKCKNGNSKKTRQIIEDLQQLVAPVGFKFKPVAFNGLSDIGNEKSCEEKCFRSSTLPLVVKTIIKK